MTQQDPLASYKAVPKLRQLRNDVLFGDIWERPQLSKRDRSLITVAVLTNQGKVDELRGHLGRALDNGVTPEEISELITHVAFYAGWPSGVSAARLAQEVFDQRGVEGPTSP